MEEISPVKQSFHNKQTIQVIFLLHFKEVWYLITKVANKKSKQKQLTMLLLSFLLTIKKVTEDSNKNKGIYCLRGLNRFELGQDSNLWFLNFYNETVEKKAHQYFLYDTESQSLATRIIDINTSKLDTVTKIESITATYDGEDNNFLTRSYILRYQTPQTTRSLSSITSNVNVVSLWDVLLNQCRSKNTHTFREVYQQLINTKMDTSDSLISYPSRIQELVFRMIETEYKVSETHKWCILTRGLLDIYKNTIRTIIVSIEERPYAVLVMKFEELSREDFGDPNIPIKKQEQKP